MIEFFQKIMSSMPRNVDCAFAYGSGVFAQRTSELTQNMIDMIFVVNRSESWHKENIKINPEHYSCLRFGGPQLVTMVQEQYGAKVYFNTLVPMGDRVIKYGVITTEDFADDLVNWRTLYISGRLHKPVMILKEPFDIVLNGAMEYNLRSALHVALLCLPATFTDEELFMKIAQLSYMGDHRMRFGEDKHKIKNIVLPQIKRFHDMYDCFIDGHSVVCCKGNHYVQNRSATAVYYLMKSLPIRLKERIIAGVAWDLGLKKEQLDQMEMDEILHATSSHSGYPFAVENGVQAIVSKPALTQTIKGLFTAGLKKSAIYGTRKMVKMFRSLK